jgi:transposase InsO family protein
MGLGRVWANSDERTAWLPAFLAYCNARRPHSALGYKTPASRLAGNNLLQLNRLKVREKRITVPRAHP